MMFFHFLKIIFDINTSKRSKTYKPYSILVKKKFKIFGNAAAAAFPNIVLKERKSRMHWAWKVKSARLVFFYIYLMMKDISFILLFIYLKKNKVKNMLFSSQDCNN